MQRFILKSSKRFKLEIKNKNPPQKYKLNTSNRIKLQRKDTTLTKKEIEVINIIECSNWCLTTDYPHSKSDLSDINHRICSQQKEEWANIIREKDPRIIDIKIQKNIAILICKSELLKNKKFVKIFLSERNFNYDSEETIKPKRKTRTKKENKEGRKNRISPKARSRVKRKTKRTL